MDPYLKRLPLNALVDPSTIDLLDDYCMQERISRGKAIDAAAKLLPLRKPKRRP